MKTQALQPQHAQSLAGKNVIITGASRGIGKAIAGLFAANGANIVAAYGSNEKAAKNLVSELPAPLSSKPDVASTEHVSPQGVPHHAALHVDMTSIISIRQMLHAAHEKLGGLDIFINSAGVAIYNKVDDVNEEEYDKVMNINTKGCFFAAQEAARLMNHGGRIILLGSTVLKVMLPRYAVYAASKAAVEQFAKILAVELGDRQITVNTLSPGPTDTDMLRHDKSQEQLDALGNMAPFKRLGTPDDMAQVALFLASDQGGWVNGQNLYANGGFA